MVWDLSFENRKKNTKSKPIKKVNQNEQYLCLVIHMFTRLSQNVV